jgi:hypothetical protein
MTENMTGWTCILVSVLGVLALLAVALFGVFLANQWPRRGTPHLGLIDWLVRSGQMDRNLVEQFGRYLVDGYGEHLQRRNEFWTTYGQVVIASLIITILSVLLLTKTVSAEAGLPVLSGVSGFAIAKGVAAGRSVTSGPNRLNE